MCTQESGCCSYLDPGNQPMPISKIYLKGLFVKAFFSKCHCKSKQKDCVAMSLTVFTEHLFLQTCMDNTSFNGCLLLGTSSASFR